MYNILIVDKTISPAMAFLSALSASEMNVRFIHQNLQAINSLKKEDYDLIVLGDRTNDGNIMDVAHTVKDTRKNKHTAVVCVGYNKGKVARIMKLLSPYALAADPDRLDKTVTRVRSYFQVKEAKGKA